MTGLFRILFFIFLGYIIVKAVRFFINIFKGVTGKEQDQRVHETRTQKNKIDKKDVIDAQFEEIENKENSSSNT